VSIIREGHGEIADFLETISEKVEKYEYKTVKDIFSELNESVTSLGLGKKVISKDKERNKNKKGLHYEQKDVLNLEYISGFLAILSTVFIQIAPSMTPEPASAIAINPIPI